MVLRGRCAWGRHAAFTQSLAPTWSNYIIHYNTWPFEDEGPRLDPPPGLRGGASGWMRVALTMQEKQAKRAALRRVQDPDACDALVSRIGFARSNEIFSRPAAARSCCRPGAVHAATSSGTLRIRCTRSHHRLHALDVFRGVTIAAMILVSTPGSWTAVYPLARSRAVERLDADRSRLPIPALRDGRGRAVRARPPPRHAARRRAARRAAGDDAVRARAGAQRDRGAAALHLATFRIPGVLQRIALVYLAVAWLTERRSLRAQIAPWRSRRSPATGCLPAARRLSAEGNLASFVDRALSSAGTADPLWDPEGLLSTVPAVATAMAGVFAGDWLKERARRDRSAWLWAAGAAGDARRRWRGAVSCRSTRTSGRARSRCSARALAAQALALCHWLVDVHGLARLVACRSRVRPQSAGGVFPLGRLRAVLLTHGRVAGADR